MIRKFRLFASDSRGVAAIEMAFIMPVLLLIYFGLFDLTGNVRQWTCTLWEQGDGPQGSPYPWQEDGRNDLRAGSETHRVLRGSAMKDAPFLHRCSARRGDYPGSRGFTGTRHSFRVVMKI